MQKEKKAFLAADQKIKYFYTNEGGVGGKVVRSFGGLCVGRGNGGHSVITHKCNSLWWQPIGATKGGFRGSWPAWGRATPVAFGGLSRRKQ